MILHADWRKVKKDAQKVEKNLDAFVDEVDNEYVDAAWEFRNNEGLHKAIQIAQGVHGAVNGGQKGKKGKKKKKGKCEYRVRTYGTCELNFVYRDLPG